MRNEQGQLFLAANDTEISILDATGIHAEFITQSMNKSRSQRQLLILDCCNSGAFAHGSKSASGVGKSMGIATAFEGDGYGRVVLTATDATQFAWEGDKVIGKTQNSVFTHFLIEGLRGEADRNGDGRIHVDELYDYAYEQVVRRTPKQTPGKWSYRQQGDLVLRENLKVRDVKPAPLPSDLLELLSHPNSGVRRAGIQDLISLLDGKHLGLARAAQEKLREIAENDDSLTLRRSASDTLDTRGFGIEPPTSVHIPQEKKEEVFVMPPHVTPSRAPVEQSVSEVEAGIPTRDLREEGKREAEKPVVIRNPATTYKPDHSKLSLRLIGGIAGGLVVITLCIWGSASLLSKFPMFAPKPTDVAQLTKTPTPTQLFVSSIETSIPATPTLGIGSTMTSKDGMTLLYVPPGEFTMGSDSGEFINEKPAHSVTLDAFWIDQTEVTMRMYYLCVQAGACKEPTSRGTIIDYYGIRPEFDNYPVIDVDWSMAKTYCEWVDRRLPTEAEWEKAARGPDARTYPWGNTFNGSFANSCDKSCAADQGKDESFDDGFAMAAPVGSYPPGASVYGALDMSGNVLEWVADWYDEVYYFGSPASNPLGPDSGQDRVQRSGSWLGDGYFILSTRRFSDNPSRASAAVGFRCAVSQNMQADLTPLAQTSTVTFTPVNTPTPTKIPVTFTPTITKTPTRIPVTSTSTPTP